MPSTSKHGLARGLPLKEVLDYLVPELNAHCLRLALNTPKVTEQLMKLDEQGVLQITLLLTNGLCVTDWACLCFVFSNNFGNTYYGKDFIAKVKLKDHKI